MDNDSGAAFKHFACSDDVLLLREANFHRPWEAGKVLEAWDKISERLRECSSFPAKDGKALSTRFNLLRKKHQQKTLASMRTSGREEEFSEREQLLDDIVCKYQDFKRRKAEGQQQKESEKRKRDAAGALVLQSAIGELERSYTDSIDGDSEQEVRPSPSKKQIFDAFVDSVQKQLDTTRESQDSFREKKLELLERQLDQQAQLIQLQRDQFEHTSRIQEQQMKTQADLIRLALDKAGNK